MPILLLRSDLHLSTAQVGAVLYLMNQTGYFATFVALLFAIDAIVHRVMEVSKRWGHGISSWLVRGGWVEEDPLAGKIQTKKWQEQSWQLFVHAGFTMIELMILSGEGYGWWADPRFCWIPHPRDQGSLHSPLLRFFYMAQLGVWIYTCFVHRFVDERRKDYFVMYLHHVVTICLVGVSWALDYWRIGLIVVFIHDISDIFVDSLKLINYLKLEGPRGWYGSEIAYVSCVLSWMYWRLWEYPFRVIKGAYYDTWEMLSSYPASSTVYAIRTFFSDGTAPLMSPPDLPMLVEMNVLLFVLLGLHIYWFHLFVMIGYRILTESAREASRQEYEGDSDDGLGTGPQKGDSIEDRLKEAVPDEVRAAGRGGGTATAARRRNA